MNYKYSILITGVAGLLGSRLAEWVIKNHPEVFVVGVDDLSGGFIENIPKGVFFSKLDCNSSNLEHLFERYKFEKVYHMAAYAAECVSPFIRKFNYTNNLVATANIVNLCIKYDVKRLIFTSSMAVYGKNNPPFDETMPRQPIDPYGVAKSACEMDIEIANEQHGLDYCILRPHNVYGAKQNIWDSYRNFIGIAMYKAIIGDPITVFGDGLQTRAFSEISDILEPMWNAGEFPEASKQIINLGGIYSSTILEVAEMVKNLSNGTIIHLPPRHEVRNAFSTWQKSVDILNFKHSVDLAAGISHMWNWAILQPKRERFIWSEYEIENGLYFQWKQKSLKDGAFKKEKILI